MGIKFKSILKGVIVTLLINPAIVFADVKVNGKSSQTYESGIFSSGPTDEFRELSITKAKNAAWEKYTQGFSPAKTKSYRQIESFILKNIDDYLIEVNVIDEEVDEGAKRYSVIVRATINTTKFNAKLSEISTAGSQRSGSGSLFAFVFVARQEDSIKSFDEKRTQIEMKEGSGFEKESAIQQSGTALGDHEYKKISKTTTGGSTIRKSDQVEYRILGADGVDTAMNQVLATAGFEVVGYGDVVSECGGTEPDDIKNEFTKSNEISRTAKHDAIKGSRACDVSYFAIGTLDVGMAGTDPVTGKNKLVNVTVKAQVWNIDKRLPRNVASVGPVQYQGLGSDARMAQNNALIQASENVGKEIVNQLNAKGLY